MFFYISIWDSCPKFKSKTLQLDIINLSQCCQVTVFMAKYITQNTLLKTIVSHEKIVAMKLKNVAVFAQKRL